MRHLAPLLLLAATPASAQIHGLIYPAPKAPLTAATLPAGASLIRVVTADHLTLTGIALPARAGRPTLLVFHGNGSSAADALAWFAPLVARGYGIVAAEYRGYSGNPGRATEAGLAADADAFHAEAKRRAAGRPVYVVGHSLGGGVAFGLAARHRLDALVTIGTFTRLRAMAPRLARALIADRYDNLAAVPTLDEPYFLVHGTADDVVPAAMANALYKAAVAAHRDGVAFVVEGADHQPDGEQIAQIVDAIAGRLIDRTNPLPTIAHVTPYPFS
jgi:fermentation-respiration switch protein FrsA (DUF1100 family)